LKKVKPSLRKPSVVAVLSLGLIVLGIGWIFWALISMRAQFEQFTDATPNSYSAPVSIESNLPSLELASTKILYPEYPVEGENIGSLTIPTLKRKLPIIQGTGAKELKKGVGHFAQSVLPGEVDNCVLSGHRDTVFSQLDNIKIGDQLIIETSAGTFKYEVKGTRIVHADDKTVIVSTDHAVLTLTTCYPFYALGNAPDRYIVSADLVDSK
jgi:sortase A